MASSLCIAEKSDADYIRTGEMELAEIILRKTREKRVQSGHPWIYQTEIERVDDPNGEIQPGDIVRVCNSRGAFLCKALYNPFLLYTSVFLPVPECNAAGAFFQSFGETPFG